MKTQDIDFEDMPNQEFTGNNTETQEKDVITYDPKKTYRWSPQDEFTFNGIEFNIMYNNLSQFMTENITPAGILKLADAFAVLQSKMIKMVETGKIKENQVEPVEQNMKPESV